MISISLSKKFCCQNLCQDLKSKIYDKRDDFDIDIVNFPFLDGDVRHSMVFIFPNLFVLLLCSVMLMTVMLVIQF